MKQEAQLSQRDRAMLRDIFEYFEYNVTQDHSSRSFEMTLLSRACVKAYSLKLCLYVVPFLRHSASKN